MIGHSNQGAPSQIWWEKSGNYDNHEAKKSPERVLRPKCSLHISPPPPSWKSMPGKQSLLILAAQATYVAIVPLYLETKHYGLKNHGSWVLCSKSWKASLPVYAWRFQARLFEPPVTDWDLLGRAAIYVAMDCPEFPSGIWQSWTPLHIYRHKLVCM